MTSPAICPSDVDAELWRSVAAIAKVELHRHLEGAIRLTTLAEHLPLGENGPALETLARHNGDRLAAAREWFCITKPVSSLSECMDRFIRLTHVFSAPSVLERIAFEAVEDCALENVRVLELRYSPGYVAMGYKLSFDEVHHAVLAGVTRAHAQYEHIAVGLIGILDRFSSPADAAESTDFFLKHRETFVGMDLANDELAFPDAIFPECFARARAGGLRVTVHVGEAYSPHSPAWVRRVVVDLGAERIGHGIHVMHDQAVVAEMVERGIVFEVCPSSNVLCNSVASIAAHPLRAMMDAGLRVCLNTDDPGLFCLTLTGELCIAVRDCGLTVEQLIAAQQVAYDASFVPVERRSRVWPAATAKA